MNISKNSSTVLPIGTNVSVDERLRILANVMIDRIFEEEKKYQERLKTDPRAKRIYETCQCKACIKRRAEETSRGKSTLNSKISL